MARKLSRPVKWNKVKNMAKTEAVIDENAGLVARFDGSCNPNPFGHASCACIVYRDGKTVFTDRNYLGVGAGQTCNVAEFRGLLMVLYWAIETNLKEPLKIVSDSQIVVRRMMSGTLPHGYCREVAMWCHEAMKQVEAPISFHWQRRDKNTVCDEMASSPWIRDKDLEPWGASHKQA